MCNVYLMVKVYKETIWLYLYCLETDHVCGIDNGGAEKIGASY